MSKVVYLDTRRAPRAVTTTPQLPSGGDPAAVTDRDVGAMIEDICGIATRLRARKAQDPDDIKAAAWLSFMATVFTSRL
jgi:hypothetical protein